MASPRPALPKTPDPTARKSPALNAEQEFPDAQLKPAPLRLTRESHSDIHKASTAETKPARPPVPSLLPYPETRHPRNPVGGDLPAGILELTPPPSQKPAPRLVNIVTQYETLDTISHVDARELCGPFSPRRHPRPPTPSRQAQGLPNQTIMFTEESPFCRPKQLTLTVPERRSSSTDQSDEVSPTTLTSPAHLRARLRPPTARWEGSPLKRHADTNTDDTEIILRRECTQGERRQEKGNATED